MEAGYVRQDSNGEGHLSDEQFTELLLGSRPSWVQAHLSECAACREEAERVSGAIGDFSTQSRMWAERRAAARPVHVVERKPALAWLVRPQAWAGAALTIALATGIGVSIHMDRARTVQPAVTSAQADSKKAQAGATTTQAEATIPAATLKADNELLTAIDGELRADESTPASLYGLDASTHGGRTKSTKRISN